MTLPRERAIFLPGSCCFFYFLLTCCACVSVFKVFLLSFWILFFHILWYGSGRFDANTIHFFITISVAFMQMMRQGWIYILTCRIFSACANFSYSFYRSDFRYRFRSPVFVSWNDTAAGRQMTHRSAFDHRCRRLATTKDFDCALLRTFATE